MDYKAHYEKLVERAKYRELVGYKEKHHVIPRCMGGSNAAKNLVWLTAEEHYIAHQLLTRIYPDHLGLVWAAVNMANRARGNKGYSWLRKKLALEVSKQFTGRKLTLEHKEKIAKKLRGRTLSEEMKAKLRAANRHLKSWLGKKHSSETKIKISLANKGKKHTPEHSAKIGLTKVGNKNFAGKSHSPEAKNKMRAARTGTKASEATKKKMSMSRKKYLATRSDLESLIAKYSGKREAA